MGSELSERARRVIRGLLAGERLPDLVAPGDPVHSEVSRFLRGALNAADVPARAAGRATLYSDGASRGNPGPAAYGFRILASDGTELCAEGVAIGLATNNVAEYRGAIAALDRARELGLAEVELRMDSELVVRQLNGEYRVRQPTLAELKEHVDRLAASFRVFRVRHVPREDNLEADLLANQALDRA